MGTILLYALTVRIRRKFVTVLSLQTPPHLKCVATLPCKMSSVLKATIENKTTSVTTHLQLVDCRESSPLIDHLLKIHTLPGTHRRTCGMPGTHRRTCGMRTSRSSRPDLKPVDYAAWDAVDISQGSVATHLRCGGLLHNFS